MMKKLNISTLFLALVGSIYVFVSLIGGIISGAPGTFWEGFLFLTVATAIAITVLLLFGNNKTTIRDVFFNAPIYYIGMEYFVVSGIVSSIQMILGIFFFKKLLVIQLVILAIFAVYFILAFIYKQNAENTIDIVAEKNDFNREMALKFNTIASICDNRDVKIKIEALAEEFQYSKPAVGMELEEIEEEIRQNAKTLDFQIAEKDFAAAEESVSNIRKQAMRRNEIAKNM